MSAAGVGTNGFVEAAFVDFAAVDSAAFVIRSPLETPFRVLSSKLATCRGLDAATHDIEKEKR